MNNINLFIESEKKRLQKLFSKKKHSPGFSNKHELVEWFIIKLDEQNYSCKYCETSIFTIRELICDGLLKIRKVRGAGVRGPVLEIDKVSNGDGYHPQNCVLTCYYCNNDKSYTLDGETYKIYFGEARNKFFNYLRTQLPMSKSMAD